MSYRIGNKIIYLQWEVRMIQTKIDHESYKELQTVYQRLRLRYFNYKALKYGKKKKANPREHSNAINEKGEHFW